MSLLEVLEVGGVQLTGGSHQGPVGRPRFGEVGPPALLYWCPHLSWSATCVHLWSGSSGGSMDPCTSIFHT